MCSTYGEVARNMPKGQMSPECGLFDDADFKAKELCCWCGGGGSVMEEDPHLVGGHGDVADFRGKHNTHFNLLSHTNISVNALFGDAKYKDRNDTRVVHGSYMTKAYVTIKTYAGNTLRFSLEAITRPTDATVSKYDAEGKLVYDMKLVGGKRFKEDNVKAVLSEPTAEELKKGHAVSMQVAQQGRWSINVSAHHVDGYFNDERTSKDGNDELWRIDVGVSSLSKSMETGAVAPHGLIGQTFDGDDITVDGAQDDYEKSLVVTNAQAEGAIEGSWEDYIVAGPFDTQFKYSRYSVASAKSRDVSKLSGKKTVRKSAVKARMWARS